MAVHHVIEQRGGWAVRREGAARASSLHATKAEALAAAQEIAKKQRGSEVVVDPPSGRLREAEMYTLKTRVGRTAPRAPRSEGTRTTLRVPEDLAATADRLADDLGISRNDALLRLATRGAQLYELEQHIADRRAQRWAAVVPGAVDVTGTDLPSPDEVTQLLASLDD